MMKYNLIEELSGNIRIFRDDLYPFLGGGNKGRKMDEIGKVILRDNYDAIVTTGGVQSNHCRAAAVFAATHKLRCTLVLHGSEKEFHEQSGNAKIMRFSGARIVFVNEAHEIGKAMDSAIKQYKRKNHRPYYLWGGGHTLEGGLAYIKAIKSLKVYGKKNDWLPEYIFLASGTGSTQAGILAGLDKHQLKARVVGISVGRQREHAEEITDKFYQELKINYNIVKKNRQVEVLDDYLCGGYAKYNSAIKDIAQNSLKNYGFTLDTCYTAKAFYGMKDYIHKNKLNNKRVLFWHTGGIFNFLAE